MPKECEFIVITPELAKTWLDYNHRNRTLSAGTVARLAGAIRRNEWMSDGTDAIGIDDEGGIVNGQHRLSAIIEAATPVEMLVVRGVRAEVIKVIDQGRGRTFTQWLALDGRYGQPTILAGAVDWLYRIIEGHEPALSEADRPTVPQLLDILEEHKHVEASIEPADGVWRSLKLDRKWLTAYHYVMASADPERADDFFAQLGSGEGARAGEPAFVLRERFVANMATPESKKAKSVELIAWLIKAWNAAAAGQDITAKQLVYRRRGKSAEPFPRIAGVEWLADDEQLVS